MPTTLIAVSGTSPAIITETLWALAHETPPTIPDNILIITTSIGAQHIQKQLLTPLPTWNHQSVWHTLRTHLLQLTHQPQKSPKLQLSIRTIELPDPTTGIRTPAPDLNTKQHHEETADYIINTLAPLADASDQHLIASIAGGRKTMGALLYAAMSLLGKETDRCTHILVTPPYDTLPNFYYPTQPPTIPISPPSPTLLASNATIQLANIPFVPLRNKFTELNERRTFAGLVEAYSNAERPLTTPPTLSLNIKKSLLTIQHKTIPLSGRELLTTAFLHQRAQQHHPHYENTTQAEPDYQNFVHQFKTQHPHHKALSRSPQKPNADDLTKALSSLRKKLIKAHIPNTIPYLAPERSRIGFDINQT